MTATINKMIDDAIIRMEKNSLTKYCLLFDDNGNTYICPLEKRNLGQDYINKYMDAWCAHKKLPRKPKYLTPLEDLDSLVFAAPEILKSIENLPIAYLILDEKGLRIE